VNDSNHITSHHIHHIVSYHTFDCGIGEGRFTHPGALESARMAFPPRIEICSSQSSLSITESIRNTESTLNDPCVLRFADLSAVKSDELKLNLETSVK
jgi:hypothetical protein